MKVESISSWDKNFFEDFVRFRNKIHSEIPTSFPESITDYSRYFASDSIFADFKWRAFLVKKNDQTIAKCVLCFRTESDKANLGFIDWENDIDVALLLIETVINYAKEMGIKKIKTPVDINFFIKYRIRLPSKSKPFFGEPLYPDYYHELFQKTGFSVIEKWDTYRLSKTKGFIDFLTRRRNFKLKSKNQALESATAFQKSRIRCVDTKNWDQDLKIMYELFHEAYKSMPEWEPLSFEQFKMIYDDFKYIINPWYSFIATYDGKPVGFCINFVDPLSILKKVKSKKLSRLDKVLLFLKLRLNTSCMLISHVGKVPGQNNEEIKGVLISFSKRLQYLCLPMRKILVTFQVINSPSRRSFNESSLEPYAQYVLYGREL